MLKLFQTIVLSIVLFVEFSHPMLSQELITPVSGATDKNATVPIISDGNKSWVERARRTLEIGEFGLTTAELKKELVKLKPNSDDDPRYVFAFVLVAMKEKQWASAQKYTKDILERHKDYIPARVAKARMLLTQNQILPTVPELELLAKGLDAPNINVSSDQLSFAARFLGLAVGYLEGPGKESIKATALKALISETDKISQSNYGPYSEARLAVGNEHETFVEKGEKALNDLRKDKAEDAQERRKDLESQRAKTEADAETAKRQLESHWADATASWNVAWSRCQNLSQSSNFLLAKRGGFESSIASLQQPKVDKNGNIDRNDERRYQDLKQQYCSEIAILDGQLGGLSAQYGIAKQNGIDIENKMNIIRVEAQRLGMTLAVMNGSFATADKIVGRKEKEAKKVESKLSASKLRQARAFSTYDDFNFHKEQALLIDTFPKD